MVAGALGFVYVDTGGMYRAVTWKVLQEGLNPEHIEDVIAVARRMEIELQPRNDGQQVWVDGVDVTKWIRSAEVNRYVSQISSIAEVRQILVSKQKQLAAVKGVVMDGRDIGTQVLPGAELKIFLTASVKERADRRFKEMQDGGDRSVTLEQLEQDIARRDQMDQEREISPLVRAEDALLIDCTTMTIPEVVDAILGLCRNKVGGG
jgi:cytidylate kinase